MINTAPDAPFGGFPDIPADPATTGQVMQFVVNTGLLGTSPTDERRAPNGNLANPTTRHPAREPGAEPGRRRGYLSSREANTNPVPRDLALLEEESLMICVTLAPTGAIVYDPTATSDPANPGTCVSPGPPNLAAAVPFAPRPRCWVSTGHTPAAPCTSGRIPIQTNPVTRNADRDLGVLEPHRGRPPHPRPRDQVQGDQSGGLRPRDRRLVRCARPAQATEAGWKDTVITYPGEVTRITATFDIPGLYVWHCHIVEHEDNEMMVPYCVGDKASAPGCNAVP